MSTYSVSALKKITPLLAELGGDESVAWVQCTIIHTVFTIYNIDFSIPQFMPLNETLPRTSVSVHNTVIQYTVYSMCNRK